MRHITKAPPPPKRGSRKCQCGCGQWATHVGLQDGYAMIQGCALTVHRWRRDPAQWEQLRRQQ